MSGTINLGVKKFKRENPKSARGKMMRDLKREAWAEYRNREQAAALKKAIGK